MTFAHYPSLQDRVTFITGGASGIGADLVRAFAGQGARVAFVDILDDAAEALVKELHASRHTPLYIRCDLTDIAALLAAIEKTAVKCGPIAVLVNNAANDERHNIADVTPDYWDKTQNINLRPQFFAAQTVHAQMKALGGGSIINFSSIAWRGGPGNMAAYATAKAAVQGLTKSLARAFGPDNIRVNAIEPGAVMTPRQRQLWYKDEAEVQAMASRQCIQKVLLGEEVARLALFLAADDSRMITKQSYIIDAGLS